MSNQKTIVIATVSVIAAIFAHALHVPGEIILGSLISILATSFLFLE